MEPDQELEPELIARYQPVFELDDQGNPVGRAVQSSSAPQPPIPKLIGQYTRLEKLNAQSHAAELFAAYQDHDELWTYMPQGPFHHDDEFRTWVTSVENSSDPYFYAIIDQQTNEALGVASFLRIDPNAHTIEVGWITYSPQLKHSRIATEAMFLMMQFAFDNGYRRYEWKCNVLNKASRQAALRLGMTYEGTFRQAVIVKGRNRDTAWYSILDSEWPAMKANFEDWLHESNFDSSGRQLKPLKR